jgi:hypothetical protein
LGEVPELRRLSPEEVSNSPTICFDNPSIPTQDIKDKFRSGLDTRLLSNSFGSGIVADDIIMEVTAGLWVIRVEN